MLQSPQVLKWPLDKVGFCVETDASETGYGGSLFQCGQLSGS